MIVLVVYLILHVHFPQVHTLNPCEVHKTCSECIRDFPLCHWCSSDNYNDFRCKPATEAFTGCAEIENLGGSIAVAENRNFSSGPAKVTQIKPQKFDINLRPGETQEFEISFKAAEDYPADLYFLLDASTSMDRVLKATASASAKIYEEMQKKTKNVFLGMGTFIDKFTAPYVREKNVTTYSFRHRINMTNDFKVFQDVVSNTPVGANFDDPEGGFDALAQVITCKQDFGWREESRKIIFFFTDELFHSAGDGKWGGIVQPYDGKCYTENGTYTKELEMDYPSIGMINKLATEEEVTIIFIVKNDETTRKAYKSLTDSIRGSKYLSFILYKSGKVSFQNSQLEKLISNIYDEITHKIVLKLNMASENKNNMQFTFSPDCYKKHKNNHDCKVIRGKEKTIKGNVTLLNYLGTDQTTVNLTIQGIKEKVTLDIKVRDCDCGKKIENESSFCSLQGTKKCGVCECNSLRTGKKCECSAQDSVKDSIHGTDDRCKQPGSNELCSSYGTCICGSCACDEGREGMYCQCESNSCPMQCNGRGKCSCGICKCESGWSGDACECPIKQCNYANGKECNGRGDCKCGKCFCNSLAQWDARDDQSDTCEIKDCSSCHNEQCEKLSECALCHQKSESSAECSSVCYQGVEVNVTKMLGEYANKENGVLCNQVHAGLGCYTRFQYKYDDLSYGVHVLIETELDCLKSYYWFGGGFLAAILIVGLLTLVAWKVLTELRDRREYTRFMKEHAADMDTTCTNPIYAPASTTFSNPAFRRPSVDFNLR